MSQGKDSDPDESDNRYHPATRLVFLGPFLVVLHYCDKTCANAEKNKDDVASYSPFTPAGCTRHNSKGHHDDE